jgi:molybdenum ABC transporter molybdate-binding protein
LNPRLARPLAATLAASAIVLAALPAPSAASDTQPVRLIAFVAANAMDPFNEIIAAFENRHPGVTVVPEYAGTQVLATQAEQGAPFDVFVSDDRHHADGLAREGLVGTPELLSAGHEVVIVPKANPAQILTLRDLATKQAKIVLGDDSVPIGIYTRRVLVRAAVAYGADFPNRVLGRVVSFETNVKQVLEKVALGEADAGIVYFTDVTPKYATKVSIVPIPQRFEVEALNYIAVAAGSRNADLARDLAAFAAGPEGRAIFRRHGYDIIP